MDKKLKIVWICDFSNKEVQEKMNPTKILPETSPWIPFLAKVLEDRNDIELHIIAQHKFINKATRFILRNIHYHFFNPNINIYKWNLLDLYNFNCRTNYLYSKMIVNRIVDKIKPDLIHLQGAENAYYSSAIFQFKNKYPILVTIQGFMHKGDTNNYNFHDYNRMECELKILKSFNHFGIRTKTMGRVVQDINPNAILHWHGYGVSIGIHENTPYKKKKFDLVYFARIKKAKGIEDLLKAIAILQKQKGDISSLIIGSGSLEYLKKLKDLCKILDIEKNITWAGFLPTQTDVHKVAQQAKICVLPVQYDIIPGTIIESMLLRIPVVSYNVGSIHEVNEKEEVISLVEKDNVAGLAEAIMKLLEDDLLYKQRMEKGYYRALEILDNSNVLDDLLSAYRETISDFIEA